MKQLNVRISEDLAKEIRQYCYDNMYTKQEFILKAITFYLKRIDSNFNNNNKKEFKLAPNERIGLINGVEYVTSTGEDLAI